MELLDGRVALVVGGGNDVDVAVARRLAVARCHVIICPTTDTDWAGQIGVGHVDRVARDGSDPEAAVALVIEAKALGGRLDFLVQYHPTVQRRQATELPLEDWTSDLARLTATFAVARAFAQQAEPGSAIVHIASIDLAQAYSGRATASAVANGLVGLSRALAVEWATRPICVNVVVPGVVLSDGDRDAIRAGQKSLERVLLRAPSHRLGSPEETASVVAFLVGRRAEFITGQTIWVDGGWSALTQHAEGLRFP